MFYTVQKASRYFCLTFRLTHLYFPMSTHLISPWNWRPANLTGVTCTWVIQQILLDVTALTLHRDYVSPKLGVQKVCPQVSNISIPWELSETPHPRPTESESIGIGLSNLVVMGPAGDSMSTLVWKQLTKLISLKAVSWGPRLGRIGHFINVLNPFFSFLIPHIYFSWSLFLSKFHFQLHIP